MRSQTQLERNMRISEKMVSRLEKDLEQLRKDAEQKGQSEI